MLMITVVYYNFPVMLHDRASLHEDKYDICCLQNAHGDLLNKKQESKNRSLKKKVHCNQGKSNGRNNAGNTIRIID